MELLVGQIFQLYKCTEKVAPVGGKVTTAIADMYNNVRSQLVEQGIGLDLPTADREMIWADFVFAVGQMKAVADHHRPDRIPPSFSVETF